MNYKVIKTKCVGRLIPCPCDDPVILEFKHGMRDAFWLRQLTPTDRPITNHPDRRTDGKRYRVSKKIGPEKKTVKQMVDVFLFLQKQSEPVRTVVIQKAVGGNVRDALYSRKLNNKATYLEGLGIVERVITKGNRFNWQLTEIGRREGESILKGLIK